MLAIAAAVVFLISIIFQLASLDAGPFNATLLNTIGFLLAALYLAGIGRRSWR